MAVNPLYTPGELEYLRAFRQGQVPDVGLLGDPAAPEATYAELYGAAPANDPGVGLPAGAVAGPPQGDQQAIQDALLRGPPADLSRDVQTLPGPTRPPDLQRDIVPLAGGMSIDPGMSVGQPAASEPAPVSAAPRSTEQQISDALGSSLNTGPANVQPIIGGKNTDVALSLTDDKSKAARGLSRLASTEDPLDEVRRQQAGAAPAAEAPAAMRRAGGTGQPRAPLWEEKYAKAGGRDPRFAPLGIPITPGEADSAMTRARQVGNLQVEQTEEMLEAGRQMAEADSAAEAMKAGYVEEQARRDRERTDILEGAERNMRSLLDEVTAEPIDSQRHWNSKNTGEKILSSIAVGLGALGSGLTGAPNFAFEKLQSEIRNDIEAQKANKAFAQSRAMAEGSLIQLARDRFDDERMQDLSMQQAAWNLADKELERFATLAKAPAQQTAIEEMRTKIAAEQETLGREFRTALDSYALARIAARQKGTATKPNAPEADPRFVPGLGFARTIKEGMSMREGLKDYLAAKRQFRQARGFARSLSAKLGSTTLDAGSEEFHQADALSQRLKNTVARSFGGVITEGDRQAAAKEVPQLTRMWGGLEERLEQAEQGLDRNYRAAVEATIIGSPVAPVPVLEGDEPDIPLPKGSPDQPGKEPREKRGAGGYE